ncbi:MULTISPECIES: AAA family ATPase [unclassified Streptomyces]|uniref:ATP-binding protein n=1 Tax=unclassified Streptomyces TaxID=2593676 RepID=UPI00278BD248|nr:MULTISPECIES: AAA family ATPase [unclassified Streptomyces]
MESLPVEVTQFIGRQAELTYLEQELTDHRLLTLTGVGGVGKTRLAARLAQRAGARVADTVCFVPLSPLRDPTLLGNVLLEELRLADNSNEAAEDVIAQWLADKRVLLVLDTCEHLIGDCARLARRLLDAAPELRILATSRQPLGLADEHRFAVAPLPLTAGDDGRPGDAVALFADRAALASPAFALGTGERAVAEGVCRRLDGIPLAIELAAARLAELPLERLESLLNDRFDVLAAREGTAAADTPERHHTLRSAIGWSHELCTPLERLLWARLSVFTGGFDATGARTVGGGGPLAWLAVDTALDALVAKSLVRRRPGPLGEERYDMLDTVREFGGWWLEQLGPEEVASARRGHRDFLLDLARRADAGWMGPEQGSWYERLMAEHANFRTAMDFCLETADGPAAQELCGHLRILWFPCGFAREGRRYAEAALALTDRPRRPYLLCVWGWATAALAQGDTEAGLRAAQMFRDLTKPDPSAAHVMAIAYLESTSLLLSGRPHEAGAVIDAAPDLRGYRGPYDAAWCLATAGRTFVHALLGEYADGAVVARKLKDECERRGERWSHTWADWTTALAENDQGRPGEAARYALSAIAGKARFRDRTGVALAVEALADALSALGGHGRAARLLGIGQRLWQGLGLPQLGSPELRAVRHSTEHRIRAALGDSAYEALYAAGLDMTPEQGIAYSLGTGPGRG